LSRLSRGAYHLRKVRTTRFDPSGAGGPLPGQRGYRVKRILFVAMAWAVFSPLAPSPASAFDWRDVRDMKAAGIADSLIAQKIVYSGEVFHLYAGDIKDLQTAGVSDEIISLMLRTEASRDSAGAAGPGGSATTPTLDEAYRYYPPRPYHYNPADVYDPTGSYPSADPYYSTDPYYSNYPYYYPVGVGIGYGYGRGFAYYRTGYYPHYGYHGGGYHGGGHYGGGYRGGGGHGGGYHGGGGSPGGGPGGARYR
jgi:hypothetical protein